LTLKVINPLTALDVYIRQKTSCLHRL